jgi:hypothetical protein
LKNILRNVWGELKLANGLFSRCTVVKTLGLGSLARALCAQKLLLAFCAE